MVVDTMGVLRESAGITTTLALSDTGERVVVRRLDPSRTWNWSRQWLEDELEAIRRARLSHVETTEIVEWGADRASLTRRYIVGQDIREWFARVPRPAPAGQLQVMCTLFDVLAQLHRLGIAHGGIHPSNIIIEDGTDHLVLLDAGVTRTQLAGAHPFEGPEARYLLPEPAGPAHSRAGFTTDLHAAGWVLLEGIAEANHTSSALRRSSRPVRTVTELATLLDIVGVPCPLRPIFLALLNPGSGPRHDSAEEVLAALEAVLATGEGGTETTDDTTAPTVSYAEPPLVGRQDELATLIACTDGARRSSGTVACLSGASGLGKSRLLDAVAAHAVENGMAVVRAGAFDHAPARPLGLFAGPIQTLLAHLADHPSEAARVREQLGDQLPAVLQQLPELAEVLGEMSVAQQPATNRGPSPISAAPTAVARLLLAAFGGDRPGLVIVDDCQWADDLSWRVIAKLAAAISSSAAHVSLICSYHPQAATNVEAWGIEDLACVDLQPLSAADTETLIRSFGEAIPDQVLPYVLHSSRGNPLETLLAFQALLDSSALTHRPDGWVVDDAALAEMAAPAGQQRTAAVEPEHVPGGAFVAFRLQMLSPAAQQALRQGAVLGRRFAPGLLCRALGASPAKVAPLLAEGYGRGFVRKVVDADEYEFTHDRFRDGVLSTLSCDARRELHLRAARALQSDPGAADYDIAYHYDRAGHVVPAMPYALRAGEAGLRRNALDVAEDNFRIAAAGLAAGEPDDTARFRVHEGLGTVHMLLGNYDPAARELSLAYELTGTRVAPESARLATLLGELAFKTGRFNEATPWMHRAMADLGIRVPRSSALAAAGVLVETVRLGLGWLQRRVRRPRTETARAERNRLAARIHNRLVYEWWFVRSPIWVLLAIVRGLRFAEASGSIRERAQAYSSAALISGVAPVVAPLALRLADRSLRLRQRADEGWGIAQSHHFRGFVLHAARRYEEAIAAFDTAIASFDIVGDRWEQVAAMWQKSLCLAALGRLHEAGVLARDTFWESKRRGDRIGTGTALGIWVRCSPRDVDMDTITRELRQTDPDDHHTMAMLQAARGWRLVHAEQYAPALDAFEQAEELLRSSGVQNHFVAPIRTRHLQVLRLARETGLPVWTAEGRLQVRNARRMLASSRWSILVFRTERPEVLREQALMHFALGHRWRGRRLLGRAAGSAARHGMAGELTACALVANRVGLAPRRGPLGSLPTVTQACRQWGIRVDRGIVEAGGTGAFTHRDPSRHQALLDAVAGIVGADEVAEVLDRLRDAVFSTTTARRVEIVRGPDIEVAESASAAPESHGSGGPPEMKLTERSRHPIVAGEDADADDDAMVIAAFPTGERDHHSPTVEVLAALAGASIRHEKLRRESMGAIVAVQEAERGRIARDLHDEFGFLSASMMDGLRTLEHATDPATRQSAAADLRAIIRQGVQAARAVAWSLRPSGLEDLGFIGCVEQYVDDCRHLYPIRIEFTATGPVPEVSESAAIAVFRIVQEALTNVGRHSGASEASVIVVSSPESVRAVIEDNGMGFDVERAAQGTSLGLVGMRERARLVGGRLSVESHAGLGTTIMVEVPLTP